MITSPIKRKQHDRSRRSNPGNRWKQIIRSPDLGTYAGDPDPGFVVSLSIVRMWCSYCLRFLKYHKLTPWTSLYLTFQPLHTSYIPVYCLSSIIVFQTRYHTIYQRPPLANYQPQTINPASRHLAISLSHYLTPHPARPCSQQICHLLQPPLLLLHGSRVPSPHSALFSRLLPRKTTLSPMRSLDGLGREDDAVDLSGRLVESWLVSD